MFTRRDILSRFTFMGITLAVSPLLARSVLADPEPDPKSQAQLPKGNSFSETSIYPFMFGGLEAFVIHDGKFQFPAIQPMFAPEASATEVEKLQRAHFVAGSGLTLDLNVLVLKKRTGVVLIDSGIGAGAGPGTGKMLAGLARIGISPEEVKEIFITHAHPDHIGGLVRENGESVFPKATIFISKREVDFWTSPEPDLSGVRAPDQAKKGGLEKTKSILGSVKKQLKLSEEGPIREGVELVLAPGHTPGHSLFLLKFGGDSLVHVGDAVHLSTLQFPHPEWSVAFDVNPAEAIRTRQNLFRRLAADRTMIAAFHLPFPGLGHVAQDGNGYEWVPRSWSE